MAKSKTFDSILRRLLRQPFWPKDVKTMQPYHRLHDDHDGTQKGVLIINFSEDGDAWVTIDDHTHTPLRFRHPLGGGRSPHTYAALLYLAEAIRLDNENDPI
jgi:hypothetical protein